MRNAMLRSKQRLEKPGNFKRLCSAEVDQIG